MKFGKHIQKRQLDIPEYAASFVDYKALKKLIKKLSATPVIHAQDLTNAGNGLADSQASLQANKATFFFRLERELEKVNIFYLQKEAELKLRLKTLADRKKSLQARGLSASKLSTVFVTLDEGFRLFNSDLDKLQQFIEINQTAFSKILKKVWFRCSKTLDLSLLICSFTVGQNLKITHKGAVSLKSCRDPALFQQRCHQRSFRSSDIKLA